MEEKLEVLVNITTNSDESIAIRREVVDNELRIKFIKNFSDAVEISANEPEKFVFISKGTIINLTFFGEKGDL